MEANAMTKRIVSGIFILTALGALGVILAGALTSGEQLIVRFLTAVIVAALGLYVISDLRLQADDDALTGRTGGTGRVGKVNAPPNSTAAFMATVTRKVDPRNQAHAASAAGASAGTPLRFRDEHTPGPLGRLQDNGPAVSVDGAETTVVGPETLAAAAAGRPTSDRPEAERAATNDRNGNHGPATQPKRRPVVPVASKRPKHPEQIPAVPAKVGGGADTSLPAGAETIVASKPELQTASDHALAGVGVVASAAGSGDGPLENDGPPPPDTGGEFLSSQSIDISDLFVDEGARANLANVNGGSANGNGNHDSEGNGALGGDDKRNGTANGTHQRNGSVKQLNGEHRNGTTDGEPSSDESNGTGANGNGSTNGYWADDHISGRLSETPGAAADSLDAPTPDGPLQDLPAQDAQTPDGGSPDGDTSANGTETPMFDPTERVYDPEGIDPAAVAGTDDSGTATEFQYSDDLHSADYAWPGAPATGLPEPHPFEKASAAYEAAKRKVEEAESVDASPSNVAPITTGGAVEPAADDAPLAPIIDLRELVETGASDIDAAINAGEVEVIATLIEQGMLATSGPISDREVRTMVYVAFTSNELRKLLLAGGTPDGPNYGLDLGPVELFDERIHSPAPKRLYSGAPVPQETPQPTSQIG
ncbi:MAG: hypothetical protein AAGA65_09925 [Actinomycetota bacterium]